MSHFLRLFTHFGHALAVICFFNAAHKASAQQNQPISQTHLVEAVELWIAGENELDVARLSPQLAPLIPSIWTRLSRAQRGQYLSAVCRSTSTTNERMALAFVVQPSSWTSFEPSGEERRMQREARDCAIRLLLSNPSSIAPLPREHDARRLLLRGILSLATDDPSLRNALGLLASNRELDDDIAEHWNASINTLPAAQLQAVAWWFRAHSRDAGGALRTMDTRAQKLRWIAAANSLEAPFGEEEVRAGLSSSIFEERYLALRGLESFPSHHAFLHSFVSELENAARAEEWMLRAAALRLLLRIRESEPELKQTLRTEIQADANPRVRALAVEGADPSTLSRWFDSEPWTFVRAEIARPLASNLDESTLKQAIEREAQRAVRDAFYRVALSVDRSPEFRTWLTTRIVAEPSQRTKEVLVFMFLENLRLFSTEDLLPVLRHLAAADSSSTNSQLSGQLARSLVESRCADRAQIAAAVVHPWWEAQVARISCSQIQ